MTEEDRGTDRAGRRRKRFLSPQEKYEIWIQLLRREAKEIQDVQGELGPRFGLLCPGCGRERIEQHPEHHPAVAAR
jgi:predicted Fe-S protein YdhL (DUF1289 family)